MKLIEEHGELVVMNKNHAIKQLLENAPAMCANCGHRPAEVHGIGGPLCVYCEDQIDL